MSQLFLGLGIMIFGLLLTTVGGYIAKDGWDAKKSARTAAAPLTQVPRPEAESSSQVSKEIADLSKRLEKLNETLGRSPAIDTGAQLGILKGEHERLAEKKDELTKAEKDALEDQAITLESLEAGRKRTAEMRELEKRQKENAQRQTEIERDRQAKEALEANDRIDRGVAERLLPACRYATAKLHQMLAGIAKQSSLKLESDFPVEPPSLEQSKLMRNGKFVNGNHTIRLGGSQRMGISRRC